MENSSPIPNTPSPFLDWEAEFHQPPPNNNHFGGPGFVFAD